MRNGLNFLLLALLAGCPPLFGQDETNAAPYGNAGAYSNAGPYGYGVPAPMPGQPPPPGARPMLRPPMLARPRPPEILPRSQPQMLVSNLEQQRLSLPPGAIPPTELAAPTAMRISNGPIREFRAVGRPGEFGWTVEVCTNAADLANGCLETGFQEAEARLGQLFYQEYHLGRHLGGLRVILPASLTPAQQTNFLYQVESGAISITQRRLDIADGKFALRAGDTPQARQDKQAAQTALNSAVQAWADRAQAEAGAGSNWEHDWPANAHTFVFGGAAFDQFKAISQAVREEPAPGMGGN